MEKDWSPNRADKERMANDTAPSVLHSLSSVIADSVRRVIQERQRPSSEPVRCLGQTGFKLQSKRQMCDCFRTTPRFRQGAAQIAMRFGKIGTGANCFAIMLDRLFDFALIGQRVAKVVVRLGESRLQAERSLIMGDRLVDAADAPQRVCQIVVRVHIVGNQLKCDDVLVHRFVYHSFGGKGRPQVIMGPAITGIRPERDLIVVDGFIDFPLRGEDASEVDIRGSVIRRGPKRGPIIFRRRRSILDCRNRAPACYKRRNCRWSRRWRVQKGWRCCANSSVDLAFARHRQ